MASIRGTRQIGQASVFTGTWKNDSDVLTDPDNATFYWRTPDGVETSYVYGSDSRVTRVSTGVYEFAAPTYATVGPHFVRCKSTGTLTASDEAAIGVIRTRFSTT